MTNRPDAQRRDMPRYASRALLDAGLAARDPALIDDAAVIRARAVAAGLPAALGRAMCLECRLAAGGPHAVDLSVHVDRDGGGWLARCAVALDRAGHAGAWDRVRTVCHAWAAPDTLVHRLVDHLWLEFDLPRDLHGDGGGDDARVDRAEGCVPAPSVFVSLDRDAVARGEATAGAVLHMLALLRGALAGAALRDGVRDAIAALPTGAALESVAVMLARDATPIRLCPARLSAAAWPLWLRRLGAEALADALAAAVDDVLPPTLPIALGHVDVGADGVDDRVGLEITLDRASQRHGALREHALLHEILAPRWCTPARRDALLRWPGTSTAQLPHRVWRSRVVRRVNDVKLVIDTTGVREAKAYLVIVDAGPTR